MPTFFKKASFLGLAASLVMISSALANVPVNPADYTGSRDENNGITATADWGEKYELSWNITENAGVFHYIYSFDAKRKDPSGFILELSDNITKENFASNIFNIEITNGSANVEGPKTFPSGHPSTPGMPADIYGIRFEFGDDTSFPMTIEFDSTRAPMWGDFYSKDGVSGGVSVHAFNVGFGTDPTIHTEDFTNWIAVPDTKVVVPEPETYMILGTCLALGLFAGRRRMQAKAHKKESR